MLQVQYRQVEDVDNEHEQAAPAYRLEQALLGTVQESDNGNAGHLIMMADWMVTKVSNMPFCGISE